MAASIGEKQREGNILEHVARNTAEDHLAEAGMSVAAHYEHIRARIEHLGLQFLFHDVAHSMDHLCLGSHVVSGERRRDIISRRELSDGIARYAFDGHDPNSPGIQEKR